MAENKVQLEIFEGPLDLLLYLVKKEEVDIYEVNLTKIATQFIEYVELMRELDLDIAGEFLVMAATLMFIKSRELLPKNQQPSQRSAGAKQTLSPSPHLRRTCDPSACSKCLPRLRRFRNACARLRDPDRR